MLLIKVNETEIKLFIRHHEEIVSNLKGGKRMKKKKICYVFNVQNLKWQWDNNFFSMLLQYFFALTKIKRNFLLIYDTFVLLQFNLYILVTTFQFFYYTFQFRRFSLISFSFYVSVYKFLRFRVSVCRFQYLDFCLRWLIMNVTPYLNVFRYKQNVTVSCLLNFI